MKVIECQQRHARFKCFVYIDMQQVHDFLMIDWWKWLYANNAIFVLRVYVLMYIVAIEIG